MSKEIDCPKCCGAGKLMINSKRCKLGLHEWHVIDWKDEDARNFKRQCLRCDLVQRCEIGIATTGKVYSHYYTEKQ